MTARIRNMYAVGNTAEGIVTLYESLLKNRKKLFILKGGPGTGKSSMIKDISERLLEQQYDIELLHSALDPDALDGVLVPALGAAVIDGSYPYLCDPQAPGVWDELINLEECLDQAALRQEEQKIREMLRGRDMLLEKAFDQFAQAKKIHLQREEIYAQGMDYDIANQLTEDLIDKLFSHSTGQFQPRERHMFFGAATPNGVTHFIDNLTEDVQTRVILKGRPGSGKSTLLRKIQAAAKQKGYNTEIYQCGFDPGSLDMIMIPQLKWAIVDGTSPHELEATRPGDEILDMYEHCFRIDIDQVYRESLTELNAAYAAQAKQGITCLAEAKKVHDQLEAVYTEATYFDQVMAKKEYILTQLLS